MGTVTTIDPPPILSLSTSNPDSANDTQSHHSNSSSASKLQFDFSRSELSPEQKEILVSRLQNHRSSFAVDISALGKTNVCNHHIETVPGAKPVRRGPYYTTPANRKEIDRQVDEMIQNDIIEPSNSAWHSPVLLVKKPSGEFRFVVDYRDLNKSTVPMSFPLPQLGNVFDALGDSKAQWLSSLDLRSGFWQIGMEDSSKHKAAFITQSGVYEWKRMPFGLMNAPISFQTLITNVLRDINWKYVLCYIDDILIFSKTFEEHLEHIEEVLSRLRQANLKLHPSKCHFALKELKFLGHIITRQVGRWIRRKQRPLDSFQPQRTKRKFAGS